MTSPTIAEAAAEGNKMTRQEIDLFEKIIEAAWARNERLLTALMLKMLQSELAAFKQRNSS